MTRNSFIIVDYTKIYKTKLIDYEEIFIDFSHDMILVYE